MKRFFLKALSFSFIAVSLLGPTVATAADSKPLVLQTSPLPINLSANPGTAVSADLRVKQNGSDTERLKVSLMKFGAFGNTGKPELIDRQPGDDYFDWVKFDKTQFSAPPNVWQTVHMTINVPKTAAFGYYYAVVFSRVGDDVRQGGRTNSINGGSAVLVLLDAKSPNAKRQLEVVSFKAQHSVYEFLPSKFDVNLKNIGNVHAVPQGDVFIMKGNKQIATLPINGGFGNILPNSNRIYPVEWNDGFPVYQQVVENGKVKLDKKGNAVQKLTWDWSHLPKFRMGKYTAHLFAVYDDGQRDVPIEAEVSFWVIPWRFLGVLLLVLLVVGFGFFSGFRGVWRRAARLGRRKGRR
jgi:hypothetical protein